MGTIAEKLLYLSETKTKIKDSITSIGVNMPNETTFRQYAEYIRQIQLPYITSGNLTIQQTGTNSIPINGELVVAAAIVPASGVKLVVTPDSPSHYYGSDGIVYDSSQNQFNIVVSSPGIVGFTFEYTIVSVKK